MISANANSKLELTVEGTLDKQEKKEIKEVLMNLFKMVKDFMTGDGDTEEIHNFANLTTIAEVKAEFDISTNVTTAAQSAANYAAQTALEDKAVMREVETANPPVVSKRVDRLTDRMIQFVKDIGVEPSKILKRLNRRFSRLFSKFANAGPEDLHRMRLRQEILQDFAEKLKNLSAENEAEVNDKKLADAEKAANLNESATLEKTSSASETILEVASQNFHFEMEYSVNDDN
jgi:hypothetical protein